MLGVLGATSMAEAKAATLPTDEIARSRGVMIDPTIYHVRDSAPNTHVMQWAETITSVTTIAERMKEARLAAGLTQAALAKKAGVSQSTIGNFEAGRGAVPRELLAIAAAANVRAEWLKTGQNPKHAAWVAHPVSPDSMTMPTEDDSPRVEWGSMKLDELPKVFRVEVPDDAMADRVLRGHVVKFETGQQPRAGDGVLVVDSSGCWFFRVFSPGAQGRFSAVAKNPAYQTLDSERDGLVVLAVLVGVPEARWG